MKHTFSRRIDPKELRAVVKRVKNRREKWYLWWDCIPVITSKHRLVEVSVAQDYITREVFVCEVRR